MKSMRGKLRVKFCGQDAGQYMKNVCGQRIQNFAFATQLIDITYRLLPKYKKSEDELNTFNFSPHIHSNNNFSKESNYPIQPFE